MDRNILPPCRRSSLVPDSAVYCHVLSLMLIFAANADAAVHYYFGNLAIEPRTEQPLDINLEVDDFDDIVLTNFVYDDGNFQGAFVPYAPGSIVGFHVGLTDYVTALAAGAVIGPSTLGNAYEATLAYGAQAPDAQFNSVNDAFLGFAFPIGPANLHYAWIRVDVNNAAGTFLLKDWAYQDQPGVAIAAGDVGTLPLPGDFTGDRRVDGADFLKWQREPSNYNSFDFLDWRQNFGAGVLASPSAAAVPEPGCRGALSVGVIAAAACLRRRRASSK